MRRDSLGFFWTDIDDRTQKKIDLLKENEWAEVMPGYWCEKRVINNPELDHYHFSMRLDEAYAEVKGKANEKCEPPEPVWLEPDYLPHIEEAREFKVDLFTDTELVDAAWSALTTGEKHKLVFDIECYPNYFLVAFRSVTLGKITYLEMTPNQPLDTNKLNWIAENFCLVGFNSFHYDIPIMLLAISGKTNAQLQSATSSIILEGLRSSDVLARYKVKRNKNIDTVDLIEVAPLRASLKIYGGRLHSKRMQDLPFPPGSVLSEDQITCVRWYCINDLITTQDLGEALSKELALRQSLNLEHGLDLRSKSDAQIAEAIISNEITKLNRSRIIRPDIHPGTTYYYKVPHFIQYRSPLMQHVLQTVRTAPFVVNESGKVGMPEALKALQITIGQTSYTLGIGGLHSCEKKTMHYSDKNYVLVDRDVTSYYPAIILSLGLYPQHLGPNFLRVYKAIVDKRIAAKRSGDKTVANSLKITINGSFGKFGNMYSLLYSPDLLFQVTITGQLSLLLLIERLELVGIPVVSANTDGLVIKCPRVRQAEMDAIVAQWEHDTSFETEATHYQALLSRDVNNYVAVKQNPEQDEKPIKSKGAFARPGLQKNPTSEICIDAVEALLLTGAPIEHTVRACTDIRKFVTVRTVKGGAVKDGTFLGKAIRWYYAKDVDGVIVYAESGKKVPRSDGAMPLMDLPAVLPQDINYEWYEKEAYKILKQGGYPV